MFCRVLASSTHKAWGPFHERFYRRMENMFKCKSITVYHIITKFCTWYDSRAKVYNDRFNTTMMRAEWNFNRIWNTMKKSFVGHRTGFQTMAEHGLSQWEKTLQCNVLHVLVSLVFKTIICFRIWLNKASANSISKSSVMDKTFLGNNRKRVQGSWEESSTRAACLSIGACATCM